MKKTGIICAVTREAAPFLRELDEDKVTNKALLQFHEGRLSGTEVVVLYSGVCKVNAAIAAQILIESFQVDAIINAGTAGGIDSELKILDTVISTEVAYHDVSDDILTEFHPWMESIYFKADSGREQIIDKYSPLTTDMETAAIVHVCYANQIPFMAVRCITDTAEHSGSETFEVNCEKASEIAKDVVLALLKTLSCTMIEKI